MSTELNNETDTKQFCDNALLAVASMMDERGAEIGMIIDRLLTFAAAQAVLSSGSPQVAQDFRRLADNIESGIFSHLDDRRRGQMN